MSRIFFAILLTSATLFAGYLESYTARIGPADHRNSRGMPLRDAGEILRQDRANYYRFGHADPEDTGISYFHTSARRARIPRMLRRGWIEPGLASEIRYGNPLVRVEVYSNYLEIHRLGGNRSLSSSAPTRAYTGPTLLSSTLPNATAVRQDAQIRLQSHGGPRAFGLKLRPTAMKHRITLVEPCRKGNEIKLFVLAESNARSDRINHCHACSPALSVLIYRRTNNGWEFESAHYGALYHGAWGEGPSKDEAAFIHLSSQVCGLAILGGYSGQGWNESSYVLYRYHPNDFAKVFAATLSLDNGGTLSPDKTDWNSTLRLLPGRGDLYEIHLHRKGIDANRPVDYRVIYRYDGIKYRPNRPDPLNQFNK